MDSNNDPQNQNPHKSVNPFPLQIFVFGPDKTLGEGITNYLKRTPSKYEIKYFADGERLPHQTETVRGRDVFIILTSLNSNEPRMDSWMFDYLRFVRNVRDGHPNKITVVLPKLIHQRQDVENLELREAAMSDFYPDLLKTAGANHLVVCKLHNPASRNKNLPTDNVDTTQLIIKHLKKEFPDTSHLAIAAGDFGGSKYARKIAEALRVPVILVNKERHTGTGVSTTMEVISSEMNGVDTVVFVDDIISTAATLAKGADAVNAKHSKITNFYAVATHADFGEGAADNINKSRFKKIWITDTVPVAKVFLESMLSTVVIEVIPTAKLLAQTIVNLHNGESVTGLWNDVD